MKYEKQFRIAHPETVGETDSHFDLSNYADWLEKKYDELLQQRDELKEALIDMVWQFAYTGSKGYHTGGLSALEGAFDALGLSDPITILDFEAAIKNTER